MRRLLVLLILSITVTITGCGEKNNKEQVESNSVEEVTTQSPIEIPIEDKRVVTLQIPNGFIIRETDNNRYWLFDNDVTVFATAATKHETSDYDEERDIYRNSSSVSKDFGDISIVVNASGSALDSMCDVLSSCVESDKIVRLDKDTKLENMPEYSDMSDKMMLNKNNLYVPEGTKDNTGNIYISALFCAGSSWLQTWVQDGTYDEIEDKMLTLVLNNSGSESVDEWYSGDKIVYMKSGNNVVALKKLLRNEWYVYYCSADLMDYALTGINKVKSSKE